MTTNLLDNSISKCKECGTPIKWQLTKNGKYTPVNLDGSSHWATCPNSKEFRRVKPILKAIETENVEIERLGAMVHRIRIQNSNSNLTWEQLNEKDKEINRLIGITLASHGIAIQKYAKLKNKNVCQKCFKEFSWQDDTFCFECWIKKYDVEPETIERLRNGERLQTCNCDDCKRTNRIYCTKCVD